LQPRSCLIRDGLTGIRIPRRSKKEEAKDEEYLEALQSLGKEDEQTESTLHQEEGVLYRKLKLWVPCVSETVSYKVNTLEDSWPHGPRIR
jgi:hypothetical protein